MMRWLVKNVGLMLLALALAAAAWVAAEWQENPIITAEFDQPIAVRVVNRPPDIYLVDGWQQDVRVRLRAPRSVWDRLTTQRFDAVLDLAPEGTPLTPGTFSVPVKVSINLEPSLILAVEPKWIEIELEGIRERLVPVSVEMRGEPELGYETSEPIVMSDTVKVRGPASQVDKISQVVASVSVQGARDTVQVDDASLTPVDAAGTRVSGVTLDPERIQVRVLVTQQPNFKEMLVKVEVLGQPDPDYRVTDVRINPSIIKIIGSPSVLGDLSGFLTTVPISIAGRTEDVVERLPLDLPPGVATVDPSEPAVQVTVEIEPFPGSLTVTRTVTFQGLQPGLMAQVSPEVVEVLLSGPRPRLSTLLPEDVRVILDLSNLRLGDQAQLEPVVVQPEGIIVDSVIPSVIQVEIVQMPSPTPEPQGSDE